MRKWWLTLLLPGLLQAGCANLKVTKVPLDQRLACADDQIEGFRYYLSRPYVVITEAVVISETQTLINLDPGQCTLSFLEGPNQGQTVALDELRVLNSGSGGLEPLPPGELAALRKLLRARAEPPAGGVRQAAYQAAGDPTLGVADATTVPPDAETHLPAENLLPTQQGAPPAGINTSNLTGAIQIIYLPDLDEQYAIKSKNCLAKSAYGLAFRGGWELTHVGAEHDSTAVPLELLNFIDNAVNAAKSVAATALNPAGAGAAGTDGAAAREAKQFRRDPRKFYYLRVKTVLKPGVYRLNKPWEIDEAACHGTGCGLLAKIGLPTVVCTTIESVMTQTGGSGK
jgi:hypothetical protein